MRSVSLRDLFAGGTLRLLTHFVLHPEQRLHFRALKDRLGMGTGALQREIMRLEGLGLVWREARNGRVYYEVVADHPSWGAFRTLLREHADLTDVLRDALSGISGIKAAFVYGSTVRGDARPDSDIDIFIVEEGMALSEIGRVTAEAQSLLDRTIDLRSYTPEALSRKMQRGSGFLRRILGEPKAWLIGSEDLLPAH